MITRFFGILGLGCGLATSTMASDAAFSTDGKTLWVMSQNGDGLFQLTLGQSTPKTIPLPKPLQAEFPSGCLLADDQGLQLIAGRKLWQWNPLEPSAKPVALADLPAGFQPDGLSRGIHQELKGVFFISGNHTSAKNPNDADHSLYALKPGGKRFANVFVRRLGSISAAPAFLGERTVFGGDGDLWDGGIEIEDESTGLFGSVYGYRCAPIALANTDAGNSGSMGVAEVVFAGETIWAGYRGRHMGALVSIPLVKRENTDDHPDLNEQWKIQREQLAQAKALKFKPSEEEEESDTFEALDALCSWNGADGAWKIAFRINHDTFWLLEKGAKTPAKLFSERDLTKTE